MILVVAIGTGCLAAWLLFSLFFDDWDDFMECLRYYFTPDFISWLRGEGPEDAWAELKLFVYFGLAIGTGFATDFGLHKLLGF